MLLGGPWTGHKVLFAQRPVEKPSLAVSAMLSLARQVLSFCMHAGGAVLSASVWLPSHPCSLKPKSGARPSLGRLCACPQCEASKLAALVTRMNVMFTLHKVQHNGLSKLARLLTSNLKGT